MDHIRAEDFRAFFEESLVAQVIARTDGTFSHLNSAFIQLMGHPKETLLSQPFINWVHPEDRCSTLEELRALASGRPTLHFENRYFTARGPRRLRWSAVPHGADRIFATVLDVTEEHARARAQEQYVRQLEMAEQMAQVGTWKVDLIAEHIHWSPEVFRIHGVPLDYVPKLDAAMDFYHPADRPVVQALLEQAIEERGEFRFKLRLHRPDGEERIVQSVGRVEVDSQGTPCSVFGVFADVTDVERIQASLVEQARRAQAQATRLKTLQQLSMLERFASLEDTISSYITAVRSNAGMKRACLTLDPDGLAPAYGTAPFPEPELARRVMEQGQKVAGRSSAGSYVIAPIQNQNGVCGALGLVGPTTEGAPADYDREFVGLVAASMGNAVWAKEQAALLEHQRILFESLFRDAPVAIVVAAPSDRRIIFANPEFERLFGYKQEQLAGRETASLYENREAFEAMGRARFNASSSGDATLAPFELRMRKADGSLFDAELFATVVRDKAGTPLAFMGQIRDITERKEVERLKSEFVAVASHELRTPLTSVIGSLKLLEAAATSFPSEQQEMVRLAARNGHRLKALVDDVLDIQKLEDGRLRPRLGRIETRSFLEEAVRLNSPLFEAPGIRVRIMSSDEVPPLYADADRLQQVLTNLLSNASKFAPPGSEVEVEAMLTESGVRIEVRDRGSGISPEFAPRVFHKFAQSEHSSTRRAGGTGLGLAICKALMEAMGGLIGFENRAQGGASFYLILPRAEAIGEVA